MSELTKLLDQYDAVTKAYGVMLAAYRTGSHRGVDKALEVLNDAEDKHPRSAIESLFSALAQERDRLRADIEKGYSDIYKTQLRYREMARAETESRGFKEGELQWLWRGVDCFKRKYDSGEVLAAVCDALTREGCTAWPGDGTSCVEQMIRLQWERAERAEAELERLRASPLIEGCN